MQDHSTLYFLQPGTGTGTGTFPPLNGYVESFQGSPARPESLDYNSVEGDMFSEPQIGGQRVKKNTIEGNEHGVMLVNAGANNKGVMLGHNTFAGNIQGDDATRLVPADTSDGESIYRYDRQTGEFILVDWDPVAEQAFYIGLYPSISMGREDNCFRELGAERFRFAVVPDLRRDRAAMRERTRRDERPFDGTPQRLAVALLGSDPAPVALTGRIPAPFACLLGERLPRRHGI